MSENASFWYQSDHKDLVLPSISSDHPVSVSACRTEQKKSAKSAKSAKNRRKSPKTLDPGPLETKCIFHAKTLDPGPLENTVSTECCIPKKKQNAHNFWTSEGIFNISSATISILQELQACLVQTFISLFLRDEKSAVEICGQNKNNNKNKNIKKKAKE